MLRIIWYGVVPHKVCHMYPAKCVLGPVNGLPGHLRYGVGLKVGEYRCSVTLIEA